MPCFYVFCQYCNIIVYYCFMIFRENWPKYKIKLPKDSVNSICCILCEFNIILVTTFRKPLLTIRSVTIFSNGNCEYQNKLIIGARIFLKYSYFRFGNFANLTTWLMSVNITIFQYTYHCVFPVLKQSKQSIFQIREQWSNNGLFPKWPL